MVPVAKDVESQGAGALVWLNAWERGGLTAPDASASGSGAVRSDPNCPGSFFQPCQIRVQRQVAGAVGDSTTPEGATA